MDPKLPVLSQVPRYTGTYYNPLDASARPLLKREWQYTLIFERTRGYYYTEDFVTHIFTCIKGK